MKRIAIVLLVVAASACSMNSRGARGPTIQRQDDQAQKADPSQGSVDTKSELNLR